MDEDTVASLSRSLAGYRSNITLKCRAATRLRNNINADGTKIIAELLPQLNDYISAISLAQARAEECIHKMIDIDPDKHGQYYDDIEVEEERSRAEIFRLTQTISKVNDALAAPGIAAAAAAAAAHVNPAPAGGNAGGGVHRQYRVISDLKPQTLTRDASFIELRAWKEKFEAYYTASHMNTYSIGEQQAYLKTCVDVHLLDRMRELMLPNVTPIYGAGGCMDILVEVFNYAQPIFTRRLRFFRLSQKKPELFSDWFNRLLQESDDSDLANLGVDDIILHRALVGCHDTKLMDLLLQEKDLDLPKLKSVFRNYEISRLTISSLSETTGSPTVTVNSTETTSKKGKKNKNKNKNKSGGAVPDATRSSRGSDLLSSGKCLRCGQSFTENHISVCKAKTHTCKICNKVGHFPSVCLSQFDAAPAATARVLDVYDNSSYYAAPIISTNESPALEYQQPYPTANFFHAPSPDSVANAIARSVNINMIKSGSQNHLSLPFRPVNLPTPRMQIEVQGAQGQSFPFLALPDSGATRTIISSDLAALYGLIPNPERCDNIIVANGNVIPCEGAVNLAVLFRDRGTYVDALVSSGVNNEILLSWYDLVELGVLPSGFPNAHVAAAASTSAPSGN